MNVTKKIVMVMAAMVLCLTMGAQSVIPAKAAVAVPMSVNDGYADRCSKCGWEIWLSVEEFVRYVEVAKCEELSHGLDCYIFQQQFWERLTDECSNPDCDYTGKSWEDCVYFHFIHLARP